MSFNEFQCQSRLYVVTGLEFEELEDFERARNEFGQKAEDLIRECYALHEAFALSLRPTKATAAIKERLMSFVQKRKQVTHSRHGGDVFLDDREH